MVAANLLASGSLQGSCSLFMLLISFSPSLLSSLSFSPLLSPSLLSSFLLFCFLWTSDFSFTRKFPSSLFVLRCGRFCPTRKTSFSFERSIMRADVRIQGSRLRPGPGPGPRPRPRPGPRPRPRPRSGPRPRPRPRPGPGPGPRPRP